MREFLGELKSRREEKKEKKRIERAYRLSAYERKIGKEVRFIRYFGGAWESGVIKAVNRKGADGLDSEIILEDMHGREVVMTISQAENNLI
ncbi:MAG: hypothetical protein UY13_C0002G0457 [Candidatus Pacebacteria bacterium GW2011_GWB1_47_8]|nr:MAG: hypothetical protein UX28_C0002G0016 [Candidatus Pacebacteria bacterium GW2011_GWA1_46_10]KKU84545.1 MAG: hypothetical protein UY13_C0002G0457 [Candidatus Pacebacteria bacterium GW2011_GWB1_47_8]HCR81674.1 hypothetical protein [Candidatus Paceibacterota bacterium]